MTERSGDRTTRVAVPRPARRMLSTTRSFTVGQAKGYLTVARTPDGRVAGVTVRMAKQGSTLAGMLDAFSTTVSRGLQHGVPLETLVADYVGTRFEPAGPTDDPDIRQACSVMDYVGRRLALDHLPYETRAGLGVLTTQERSAQRASGLSPYRPSPPAGTGLSRQPAGAGLR